MPTLFQLSVEMALLDELLSLAGGEFEDDEAGRLLEALFDGLNDQLEEKADNYCALIRELEARAEARDAESKRLAALAAADANNADKLKARLKDFFTSRGI